MMTRASCRLRSRRHLGSTTKVVLLVLCVVGVVSIAGIVLFLNVRIAHSTQFDAVKTQIKMLETAVKQYELDVGELPSENSGLNALCRPPTEMTPHKWRGPYCDGEVPLDPWGNPYLYRLHSGKRSFEIVSIGPDETLSTADDTRSTN